MQDKLNKLFTEINIKEEILTVFQNASIEKVIIYDNNKIVEFIINTESLIKIEVYNEEVNQVVAYFHNGEPIRHVRLSSYLSMLHNTDLTRAGWNQSMSDSEKLGIDMFIIPYHPFSCLDCWQYQNRPLTREEVERIIGETAEEKSGDIIHPNCKCTLALYWDSSQIQPIKYNILHLLST